MANAFNVLTDGQFTLDDATITLIILLEHGMLLKASVQTFTRMAI
jgi:hypothetical protein